MNTIPEATDFPDQESLVDAARDEAIKYEVRRVWKHSGTIYVKIEDTRSGRTIELVEKA